jgi:dodecin
MNLGQIEAEPRVHFLRYRACVSLKRQLSVGSSEESHMSVAKVTELSSTSKTSFEDAIQQGLARASKTIRNIRSLWIKEQQVRVTDGKISEYQVNMLVTFELDA